MSKLVKFAAAGVAVLCAFGAESAWQPGLKQGIVNNIGNTEQHAILERRMGEIDPSVPVYYTPGNHDIPEFTPERLQFYLDFIGYDRFSFVQKDCAFIGFDSNRIRSGNAEAEEEQYEWIISRLEMVAPDVARHVLGQGREIRVLDAVVEPYLRVLPLPHSAPFP